MNAVMQWFQSEMGRRVLVWASGALSLAVQGGILPLDYPIGPWSLGQLLQFLGIGVAATAGSSTRR
jgi:hypothetical protein